MIVCYFNPKRRGVPRGQTINYAVAKRGGVYLQPYTYWFSTL